MISKEKFVDIMNRLKNFDDMQNEIREVSRKYLEPIESDYFNTVNACIGHETVVVDLLRDMFHDDVDMLGWYIWEKDYGRDFKYGDLVDNGKKIDLSTYEKLYDYLTNENQK